MRTPLRRRLAPMPEYVAVGLAAPQSAVEARLRGPNVDLDVTFASAVVSLRPWTLAVGSGLDGDRTAPISAPLVLSFRERSPGSGWLGHIRLRPSGTLSLPSGRVQLFEAAGHRNRCVSAPRLWRFYLERWWRNRRRPYNTHMRTADLFSQYVFYICPRPVALVTAVHAGNDNLFPMDLVGPTGGGDFLLALRSTSPATPLIADSRRLALSAMPISEASRVYALGRHHVEERIDWKSLPFAIRPSARFALPVPGLAEEVRELAVEQIHVVGSHTLFVATPVHVEPCGAGRRMFHISGLYQAYLERRNRSL